MYTEKIEYVKIPSIHGLGAEIRSRLARRSTWSLESRIQMSAESQRHVLPKLPEQRSLFRRLQFQCCEQPEAQKLVSKWIKLLFYTCLESDSSYDLSGFCLEQMLTSQLYLLRDVGSMRCLVDASTATSTDTETESCHKQVACATSK